MSASSTSISLPAALFLITFALLLHPISTGSHHGSIQRHWQKRLEEVFHRFSPLVTSHATLNHGNNCVSPYEEKLRQQIVEELHLIATSHAHATVGRVKDAISKMEKFISMNDKELCNYGLGLFCDQETRKCVCGPTRVNVTFIWEGQICRYAEGSMCAATSKFECAKGTQCISITSLDECMSGLCFCQREYYPSTSTTTTTTTAPSTTPVYAQVLTDEGGGGGEVPDDSQNEFILPAAKSTGVPSRLDQESSSSEEDIGDDDDDGDGEGERIIVVKVQDVERTFEEPTKEPSSEHAGRHHDADEVYVPTEDTVDFTTVPSPVATSPTPTRRQELTSAIRRLEREVEFTKNLGFGDECSSLAEESNYAEYRRLVNDMDCVTAENDEEILMEILSKLETILETGNSMCNWTQHLQCNSQSKKCQCRTSSEDLDGFYLLFMEEAKRCVLVENSRCLSQEYLISRKASVLEIPCVSEAKCIAEETKAECKTKIENCFCRKIPKPTEASKQKKSRTKSKTSSIATSPSYFGCFKFYIQIVITISLMVYTMLLPRMILII
ncbi:unnamed protein product [Orchesella dallaii]|uniref:EB domain-containing protein n=1 Tax=Orchesella dallaii TaxID=48710 RepID=A0ABP1PPJ6_9HEXA